ncbi:MAG TPA: NAD(P)H-dependent glycerol-3-phosphate dehydrogenase [Casimicrobiaceae bacterium]|nr:NAD(P)H-dependent glycerol-3-phosphate dehydrogenase [Casimicrobiaceae bacterium]
MLVAIAGAGAWGTALAVHLATRAAAAPGVLLWARDPGAVAALRRDRENARYLPGIALPPSLVVTGDLRDAVRADLLIVATPVAELPGVVAALAAAGARAPLTWLSKGFVADAHGVALAHHRIAPLWPAPVGVISGPSFAEEVARGLPTALAVAATAGALASSAAAVLRGETLRAYESDDIAGVETGGAVKNVLAIAAGASDGLGFGHNARAALITRGLAETGRLAAALGGRRETMMGLAGLGDLVLTCTGDLSRNRRVGLALAQGRSLDEILAALGHVAEGVGAARAVRRLAAEHGVDMPICEAVDRTLHEGLPVRDAVAGLLRREPRSETH